ncbi:Hint domain-containing protein [Celeribacter sp.]|uniref:Hint domain-containing protein n=1 Tax=Celeribacter sp. TaxID=1890673 RepID=UPI003A940648
MNTPYAQSASVGDTERHGDAIIDAAGIVQNLSVYRAHDFRVVDGANLGDPVGPAFDLELADVYALKKHTARERLALRMDDSSLYIGDDSGVGVAGAQVHLDCTATFIAGDGATVEALILVETDVHGHMEACYLLPFAPIDPQQTYSLVKIDHDTPRARLAEVACVSFTRGTLITMANGKQVPIEELRVGDKVLTRDHGPQEIRWIGEQTARATGAFAPIRIKAGTLNNENDLIVSPNHRIFIYQRRDTIKAGRAEVLVKARLLVNGVNVVRSDGGFVDYFQLLFDNHEIIYAEGIAAESMFVDSRVKPYLPADVQAHLGANNHGSARPHAVEILDGALDSASAADLLRTASLG